MPSVTELRANLKDYIARARAGESITITERGAAVARLSGVDPEGVIERLTREGVIRPAVNPDKSSVRASKRRKVKLKGSGSINDIRDEWR